MLGKICMTLAEIKMSWFHSLRVIFLCFNRLHVECSILISIDFLLHPQDYLMLHHPFFLFSAKIILLSMSIYSHNNVNSKTNDRLDVLVLLPDDINNKKWWKVKPEVDANLWYPNNYIYKYADVARDFSITIKVETCNPHVLFTTLRKNKKNDDYRCNTSIPIIWRMIVSIVHQLDLFIISDVLCHGEIFTRWIWK